MLGKRIFLVTGLTLFVAFTLLQTNDGIQYGNQDAWTWIALYGLMAVINGVLIWKHIHQQWLYSWAGFTWGALLFRLQDEQGNMHFDRLHPANYWNDAGTEMIQQSNESGGLLILAIWATATVMMTRKG